VSTREIKRCDAENDISVKFGTHTTDNHIRHASSSDVCLKIKVYYVYLNVIENSHIYIYIYENKNIRGRHWCSLYNIMLCVIII